MRQEITLNNVLYKVGDYIVIREMKGEPRYKDACGEITSIDDKDQIHGTWGGCAIIPDIDTFEKVENPVGK